MISIDKIETRGLYLFQEDDPVDFDSEPDIIRRSDALFCIETSDLVVPTLTSTNVGLAKTDLTAVGTHMLNGRDVLGAGGPADTTTWSYSSYLQNTYDGNKSVFRGGDLNFSFDWEVKRLDFQAVPFTEFDLLNRANVTVTFSVTPNPFYVQKS